MLAHPSYVPWPQSELHRRPQRGNRMRFPTHVGTPVARVVAPEGAPPKGPAAGPTCAPGLL
eukprot:4619462-Pyramimonas_sp.AAC.1